MKKTYLKMLCLTVVLVGISLPTKAQTWVTVYSDDFENYADGSDISKEGYFVIHNGNFSNNAGGKAFAKIDPSLGYNGSNGYSEGISGNTNFYLCRLVTNLEVGATYRSSCATTYTSGVNHGPLNLTKWKDGTAVGGTYYNTGTQAGTGDWQFWQSSDITITSDADQIRIQHYRFGANNTLKVDDVKLQINSGIEWTGASTGAWDNTGNWAGGVVPAATDHVLITATATNPLIIDTDVTVTSLEMEDGATLTVSGNSTLTVIGQITSNLGTVTVQSGSAIIAERFQGSSYEIHRQTRFSNGKYSIVGSPVKFGTVGSLGSLVYSYDESVAYNSLADPGSQNDGLDRFVSMTNPGDLLTAGVGYFSANTDEMIFTGMPNAGTINVVMSLTDHDATNSLDENNYEGFNLVSNPYTSAIDYTQLIAVNGTAGTALVDDAIWIWDDEDSNTGRGSNAEYMTINDLGVVGTQSSTASGLWDGYIRSGQGFFVKASAAGNLSFTSAMQVSGNNTDAGFYRKSEAGYQTFKVNLSQSGSDLYNETLIGFAENASVGMDYLDAQKIAPRGALKLFSLIDQTALAIQALPQGLDETTIQLGISVDVAGSYQFSMGDMTNWNDGYSVILNDDVTGLSQVLTSGNGTYSFSAEAGTSNRFRLTVTKAILNVAPRFNAMQVVSSLDGLTIVSGGKLNTSSIAIAISDISGRHLLNVELINKGNEMNVAFDFSRNKIYILRITTEGNTSTQKILFK
jgi:hypothetical protein